MALQTQKVGKHCADTDTDVVHPYSLIAFVEPEPDVRSQPILRNGDPIRLLFRFVLAHGLLVDSVFVAADVVLVEGVLQLVVPNQLNQTLVVVHQVLVWVVLVLDQDLPS